MDIIVDLDGTLTDCRHRLHHLDTKDWDSFFNDMDKDAPNLGVLAIVYGLLELRHRIVFCSGRPSNYRDKTVAWLDKHHLPTFTLYMRREGDFREDAIIKFELYEMILNAGYEPAFVIDDRKSVVAMWRRHGLPVLQYLNPEDSFET